MGLRSTFFVASPSELAAAFPNWQSVAREPIVREVTNPFNGQKQTVSEWPPLPAIESSSADADSTPILAGLPIAEFSRIEHVKLSRLQEILCDDAVRTALEEIVRPALIHAANEDTGLHQLPDRLVAKLSVLRSAELNAVAERWSKSEEMTMDGFSPEDCFQVLRELVRLAQHSTAANAGLFLLWNL